MKLLTYSLSDLKKTEGVGNVALNVNKMLKYDVDLVSLGKFRKLLFYSFISPLYFSIKVLNYKPDVVLVHTTEAAFDPVVARKVFGFNYKIVCVAHGLYSELEKEYKEEIRLKNTKPSFSFLLNLKISNFRSRSVKCCDAIIAVSNFVKRDLLRIYGVDSVVINNGVEEKFFSSKSKLVKLNNNRILFAGNQYWLKGLHYLVKANELLQKPKRIIAIGINSPQQEELCKLVDCKHVDFKGSLSREKVYEEYLGGGLFVMPSVYESFGIAYLDALCFGMPIVASKGTGAEDIIIEGKNGFLAHKRDPESIAQAIKKAERLVGKVSKPSKKYLWGSIAQEYEKVIRGVLNV